MKQIKTVCVDKVAYEAVLRNSIKVNDLEAENQQLKELLLECSEVLCEILAGTQLKLSFKLESGIRKKDYMMSLSELKTKIDNVIGEK